jgi:hypothetical protein
MCLSGISIDPLSMIFGKLNSLIPEIISPEEAITYFKKLFLFITLR